MRGILVLILACLNLLGSSQYRSYLGLGADLGYRSVHNQGGFIAEYHFKNALVFHIGDASNKWMGVGYGAGLNVHLFRKHKWQLVFGGGASRQMGKGFYMGGEDSTSRRDYVTPSGRYLTAIVGVHHFIISPDECIGGRVSFTPYLSYRYSLKEDMNVILKSGIVNQSDQDRINKHLGSGWGVGLKLTYLIAGSPCKTDDEKWRIFRKRTVES